MEEQLITISELKEYLNNECAIYKLNMNDNNFFILTLDKSFLTGKMLISYFENQIGDILNYEKIDENKYLLNNLSIEEINTEPEYKNIINELQRLYWDGKYSFIVHEKSCNYICIDLDSDKIYDSDFLIIGVILADRKEFYNLLNEGLENEIKINEFN